jgi:ABC-type phosphate transport system permease subunit
VTAVLIIVVVVAILWASWTFGLDIFSDLFPEGFWAAWWHNVQENLGFHITTFIIGALIFTLIGALKSR